MIDKIKLVQGDTRPQVVFNLTDSNTGQVVNVAGASVQLKFRPVGGALKATIPVYLAPGKLESDGLVNSAPPYNVPGVGGRVYMNWPAGVLDEAGDFEGEIEVTFSDGSVQTTFDRLRFKVREQF